MAESNYNKDSLQQLFSRLQRLLLDDDDYNAKNDNSETEDDDEESNYLRRSRRRRSYVVLIQHSLSFQLRQQAASTAAVPSSSIAGKRESSSTTDDETTTLYRRAGLRTPAENAVRDLEGGTLWLKHVTLKLCREYPSVLWLRTITASSSSPHPNENVKIKVIDAASDPFGWDCDFDDDNEEQEQEKEGSTISTSSSNANNANRVVHIGSLDTITERIEEEIRLLQRQSKGDPQISGVALPLVLQSLTPILQRHGLNRTIHFLRRTSSLCCPLVVPVLEETLTPSQHRRLEDMSNALLCIRGGEAILLREGIREKGNLVRENIPYRIVVDNTSSNGAEKIIELVTKEVLGDEKDKGVVQSSSVSGPSAVAGSSRGGMQQHQQRPGKVHLKLEDDDDEHNKPTTEALRQQPRQPGTPQIYLQDDDPEFDDYDEEDPDDDLDI